MASSGISKGHETLDEKTHQLPDSSYGEPPVKQHYNTVTRGESIPSSDDINDNIVGYDGRLMGARTRLSSQQEKKLLRRIDWHLIPLLSVMYMVKSIDASNVSNARIMDRGTPRNIMTELNISADDYNFVTMAYYVCVKFPDTARWMSEEEKAFVQARLPINAPRAAEKDFDWKEFWHTLKDHKLWLFLLCWAFYTIGTTGLNFYQPTVIANLGFTGIAEAQLLNIPPAIFACVLTIVFGWVANTGRFPLPLIPLSFMIIIEACYVVLYTFPNTGGVYAATVIAGGFSIAWYTMMWPWRVQTTDGATGSAFAIAFANSYGQIGGAVGSQLFNSRFAPRYTTSFGIAMGFIGMAIIMNVITWSFTWKVDVATRRLKRARDAAAKRNEAILDDVDIHAKT
ncbi:Putative transporter C11D3.18C, partial [Fusarium oxysporum f. sp. cubense race 1]